MVEIKRFRFGEIGEIIDHHSIDMANALVSFSQSKDNVSSSDHHHHQQHKRVSLSQSKDNVLSSDHHQHHHHHQHKRVFECSTCSKQFPSFQALGGHRASHKKPRLQAADDRTQTTAASKPRLHECSICGLEFAMGQALGGHMRRHRASNLDRDRSCRGNRGGLCLDLNLAPSAGDHSLKRGPDSELGLGLGLGLSLGYV